MPLPLVALTLVSLASAQQAARLLNLPMADAHPSDVAGAAFTPDGSRVLFVDAFPFDDLWSVPVDGGVAVKLNSDTIGKEVAPGVQFGAGGQRVVFRARRKHPGDLDLESDALDLFGAPIDGSAPPVELSSRFGGTTLDDFRVSPDGTRVVYLSRQVSDACVPYVVPLDGSAPAQLLDGHFGYRPTWEYRVTPDSSRLVFRLEGLGRWDDHIGLFSVPLDASRPAALLHVPSILSQPFAVADDGSSVVYASHPADAFARALWRVPVDGPNLAAVELVGGIQGDVTALEQHGSTLVFLTGGSLYSF